MLLKKSVTTAWLRTICGSTGYSNWVATEDTESFTRQGRYVPLPLMQELNLHKIVCYGRRPIAIRLTDLDDCLSHRLSKETYSLWRKAVEESLLSPDLPSVSSVGPVGAFDAMHDLDRAHFRGQGNKKRVLVKKTQGSGVEQAVQWRMERPTELTTRVRSIDKPPPLVKMVEKGNWLCYPSGGFYCYPCLVAGRKCVGRRYHSKGWKCIPCSCCRQQGLSLRHCAVPRAYVKTRSSEWLQGDWAAVSPENPSACHCCQKMGPIRRAVHCHSCSAWVCPEKSCREKAKVLDDLPLWFCCHCMGIPLVCRCPQSEKEVSQLLLKTELRRNLPAELRSSRELPKTADLNRKRRRCQTWWQGTNIEPLPCADPPAHRRFLDDAGMLRKMQPLEYNALAESLKTLRQEIPVETETKQKACLEWLFEQTFAEPSLILSFLLKLHSEAEKDRYAFLRNAAKKRHQMPSALEGFIAYWPNVRLEDRSGSIWDLPVKASKEDSILKTRANPLKRREKSKEKKKEQQRQAKALELQRRKAFDEGIQQHLAAASVREEIPLDDEFVF